MPCPCRAVLTALQNSVKVKGPQAALRDIDGSVRAAEVYR